MKRRIGAWILFLGGLLVLSLGATRYARVADSLLVSIRLVLVFALSILIVVEWWKGRRESPEGGANAEETILQRCRRWYYGDARGQMNDKD